MVRKTGLLSDYTPIEKVNNNLYIVRWGIQPVMKQETIINEDGKIEFTGNKFETGRYSWMVEYIYQTPTFQQLKTMILDWYNKQVDDKILKGFKWKDMPVWLSTENQFNYKAAYDLAVQTNGANLPIMFKFGNTDAPVYYTFTNVQDITDFYVQATTYINTCLQEGWGLKDSINWDAYKIEEEPLVIPQALMTSEQ